MSQKCQSCGTAVDTGQNFGMMPCPSCGALILIGAEINHEPRGENLTTPSRAAPTAILDLPKFSGQETILQNNSPETGSGSLNLTPEISINTQPSKTERVLPSKPPKDTPQNFDDVVAFGNQPQTMTNTGGLVYDVSIDGIETAELRLSVNHILKDHRLGIASDYLEKNIAKGKLEFKALNPVVASVLISRLRSLVVNVRWIAVQAVKAGVVLCFFSQGQASEWPRHEINLKGYVTKIHNLEAELKELVKKVGHAHESHARDAALAEIKKKYTDLEKMHKDFIDEQEHVRFDHPEQGQKVDKQYRRFRPKSLEEIEGEVGVDGDLSRFKRKSDKIYSK